MVIRLDTGNDVWIFPCPICDYSVWYLIAKDPRSKNVIEVECGNEDCDYRQDLLSMFTE